jgi:hypothetical protein
MPMGVLRVDVLGPGFLRCALSSVRVLSRLAPVCFQVTSDRLRYVQLALISWALCVRVISSGSLIVWHAQEGTSGRLRYVQLALFMWALGL